MHFTWTRTGVGVVAATLLGLSGALAAPLGAPHVAASAGSLVPLTPARLLETRSGAGLVTVDHEMEGVGAVAAQTTLELRVAGRGNVPNDAAAVMLNVTAVAPQGSGFLTVFPCGSPKPTASNVNYVAGDVVPNAVLAKIGAAGKVCIFTLARTDVVVDVNGFVPAGGAPIPSEPARLLETRSGTGLVTVDHQYEGIGPVAAGATMEVKVTDRGGVPATAVAVVLNVTAVAPEGAGFLTVFPCGSPKPTASNVNYVAGDVVPNTALAKVGDGGKVCIFSLARTHLLVDINGYVPAGGLLIPFTPARLLETRSGSDLFTIDHQFEGGGQIAAFDTLELGVAGRSDVPASAVAVMLNVTAVTPDGPGFLTVYPCGSARPVASSVNYVRGDVVPNAVLAKIGTGGKVCVYTTARSHVIVDVSGYVPDSGGAVHATFHGPNPSAPTVRLNGIYDAHPSITSSFPYDSVEFDFPLPLADGVPYAVTVATAPNGQSCAVYAGATGTTPVANTTIKVGCEWRYEHVSHNQDRSVLATRTSAFLPSIGGANVSVGTTGVGYGDGRFVAFVSNDAGLSPNGIRQVFWYDRFTGELRLVSADAAGNPGNGPSEHPSISADGLHVVFDSRATNLDPADSNGLTDVFVWTAQFTTLLPAGLTRVSKGVGTESNGNSEYPTVSGDGTFVAFQSSATNIGGAVTNGTTNVFVRDIAAATNTMISVGGDGKGAGGGVPAISEDGQRVAYWSISSAIVTPDANGLWDIFVYDAGNPVQRRISKRADGGERSQGSESTSRVVAPALSGDGRFAVFVTTSPNVVTGDTNAAQDVFMVDLDGALGTQRVSVSSGGAQGNGDSPQAQGDRVGITNDGRWLTFTSTSTNFGTAASSGPNVFLHDRITGETRPLTDATFGSDTPTISREGTYVAFGSASQLDTRYASSGLFAAFTGNGRPFWWV
jgi:Tol biopolymer transport system component